MNDYKFRHGVDDVVGDVVARSAKGPGDGPRNVDDRAVASARLAPQLSKIDVALTQAASQSEEAISDHGRVTARHAKVNKDCRDEAERELLSLRIAHDIGREMIDRAAAEHARAESDGERIAEDYRRSLQPDDPEPPNNVVDPPVRQTTDPNADAPKAKRR